MKKALLILVLLFIGFMGIGFAMAAVKDIGPKPYLDVEVSYEDEFGNEIPFEDFAGEDKTIYYYFSPGPGFGECTSPYDCSGMSYSYNEKFALLITNENYSEVGDFLYDEIELYPGNYSDNVFETEMGRVYIIETNGTYPIAVTLLEDDYYVEEKGGIGYSCCAPIFIISLLFFGLLVRSWNT